MGDMWRNTFFLWDRADKSRVMNRVSYLTSFGDRLKMVPHTLLHRVS